MNDRVSPQAPPHQARRTEICQAIASAVGEASWPDEPRGEALLSAQSEIEHLKNGLRTRTVIGQATGLLMAHGHLTPEAAFARLVEMSSHSNLKVREIAAQLVADATAQAQDEHPGIPT
jgi:hypothetical protein